MSLILQRDFEFSRDVPSWLVENYQFFLIPSLLYPLMLHFMVGKFKYDLKFPLFAWNLLLSVYSGVSVILITPSFLRRLYTYGYHESVCLASHAEESFLHHPIVGKVVFGFILSKVFELIDTVFLVLRGRNVEFLHWYHHLVTLVISYIQSVLLIPTTEWATWMNLLVHTWMYGHYALSTYVKSFRGNKALTMLQISQMVHGTFLITYYTTQCGQLKDYASMLIYAVYMSLFVHFFYRKYTVKNKNE